MTGETISGAQRACCLRPKCIGAVGPRIRVTINQSINQSINQPTHLPTYLSIYLSNTLLFLYGLYHDTNPGRTKLQVTTQKHPRQHHGGNSCLSLQTRLNGQMRALGTVEYTPSMFSEHLRMLLVTWKLSYLTRLRTGQMPNWWSSFLPPPRRGWDCSLHHTVQTEFGNHPNSYPRG
jgi:hypothetical protein